jgi:hypothetical protein
MNEVRENILKVRDRILGLFCLYYFEGGKGFELSSVNRSRTFLS